MTNEQILSNFMREHYTDERLAALLAHAEDGKLDFNSCCCFIGAATADHALRGLFDIPGVAAFVPHYAEAADLPGAAEAERAFLVLCMDHGAYGVTRMQQTVVPLIRAEMERRDLERSESVQLQTVSV